jgi:hypothetical protein
LKRRVCITRCQALVDTSRHRAVPETASTSGRSRTRLVSSTLNAHLLAGSLPRQQWLRLHSSAYRRPIRLSSRWPLRTSPTATSSGCWSGPPPRAGRPAEPDRDPVRAQKRWPATQYRRPHPRDPGRPGHRTASHSRDGHRGVHGDQPRHRRHHRRAEPPNQRARSPRWPPILRHTRTPTSTSPNQDSMSCSAPGCSMSSGMIRTDTPTPPRRRGSAESEPVAEPHRHASA